MMEETQATRKSGVDATMSKTQATSKSGAVATNKNKDNSVPDGIQVSGKIRDAIAQHDAQHAHCSQDITDRPVKTKEYHSDDINDNATPAIHFVEQVQTEIESHPHSVSTGWTVPGAYSVEGPRLPVLHTPTDSSPMGASHEGGEGAALDAVLVQEDMVENGAAMSDTCEPFNLPGVELVDAKILPDKAGDQRTRGVDSKLVCVVACLVLFAAVILLPVVLVLLGSNVEDPSRPSSSSSGGFHINQSYSPSVEQPPMFNATLNPPFQKTLPTSILKDIEDHATPFFWANRWMLADPNLNRYSSERQRQRFYLAMVYYATNGDGWFHSDYWMSYNTSECHWFSSSSLPKDSAYFIPNVCTKNESLVSLSLSHNNLTGSLSLFPTALLPHLRVFDVGDNNISGAAPPVISNPNLDVLILSNNGFSESWRAGDGLFEFNLKVIMTNGNFFTSGVPNVEGLMLFRVQHSLEVQNSAENHFTGSLPTELGLCTNLIYFGRGNNNLTGTVPSELGLLTHLQHMEIAGISGINGTLPADLGGLTALTHLDITGTSVTGLIPEPLCSKVKEGALVIAANCSLMECCD